MSPFQAKASRMQSWSCEFTRCNDITLGNEVSACSIFRISQVLTRLAFNAAVGVHQVNSSPLG